MVNNRQKGGEGGEEQPQQHENNTYNNIHSVKSINNNSDLDDNIGHHNNSEIGKTIISDKHQNTIDSFWFALIPGTIVKPFDFVTVQQSSPSSSSAYHTKTIGMIQDLQAIVPTDNYHYLLQPRDKIEHFSRNNDNSNDHNNYRKKHETTITNNLEENLVYQNGITVARVAVMANSDVHAEGKLSSMPTGMPVGLGKSVRFSNAEEVTFALGIPEMAYPIPAGIIEMSNGLRIPIFLDISYLAGPDTVHVNASGISGNAKTSYLLFLLHSVYQKLKEYEEEYALIIFNTKYDNLLHIDKDKEKKSFEKNSEKESFDILNLDIAAPFDRVKYFLPRGRDGRPNSTYVPENSRTYSYELVDVYDRLELLFSEIYDPHYYNLSSIVNYIYEFWPIKKTADNNQSGKEQMVRKQEGEVVKTWTDLFNFKDYPEEIITNKASLLQFQGHIQRFRRSSLFIDKKITSTYLGKEIKHIRSGDVLVVDIAMLSTLEEQGFVIGDVMKSIDEMYSASAEMSNENNDDENSKKSKKPKYLLIFIDEINRFLPNARAFGRMNAVAEQIMKTIIAGRSRHTILFTAQQFKSTVDYSLHENTGMHITGKIGLSELSSKPYKIIDENTKMNIVRLNKGELVMIHSAFRHPIKITFPNALLEKKI